jgi:hypothetical protein
MCNKILYQTVLCLSRKKKCMRCFVIPNSSNHCTRQRIFIMYSYVCIMFYICVHQNFVCHTKQVASVPSHHRPAEGSSIVLPPLIIPRKSILLLPSISPPAHADSPLHKSSQTVDQPREEASCLCRRSVHPCPLEVALCCHHRSYQEIASCHRRQSVCPRTLTCRRTN